MEGFLVEHRIEFLILNGRRSDAFKQIIPAANYIIFRSDFKTFLYLSNEPLFVICLASQLVVICHHVNKGSLPKYV